MKLCNLQTGENIREATTDEARASARAARSDGGHGAIEVGGVICWVDGPCPDCEHWDCICLENLDDR